MLTACTLGGQAVFEHINFSIRIDKTRNISHCFPSFKHSTNNSS